MDHQTLESDRGKGGEGEQMTVQSPSLPQMRNEGSGVEQFPSCWLLLTGAQLWTWCLCLRWTQSHLSPQLPSGRYWIIQAVGNISRRKESNSLTHSLQEFGHSAPKASSPSARVWANLLAPAALGLINLYPLFFLFFLFLPLKDKAISLATNTLLLYHGLSPYFTKMNTASHGQADAILCMMWLYPGSSDSDTWAHIVAKILFCGAYINNSLLCMCVYIYLCVFICMHVL